MLGDLSGPLRTRVRIVPIPADPVLFGVVQLSRLAIAKYGYMQVSECLALRTPVVAVYHEGNTWVDRLPVRCQRFVWPTREADDRAIAAATRLLHTDPGEMDDIHNGRFGAAAETAGYLER